MKRLFILLAVAATALTACHTKIWDRPSIAIEAESIDVPAEGETLVIPVQSTGVDNVEVIYSYGDRWDIDNNGDLYPVEGWITIDKVINNYDQTRALAEWSSGIKITVAPNATDYARSANISVTSFTAKDVVEIRQAAAEQN